MANIASMQFANNALNDLCTCAKLLVSANEQNRVDEQRKSKQ